VAVSFDLFGTLVDVDRPDDPAAAVADALAARGVDVPEDFAAAYREVHVNAPAGAETPLPAHVAAALRSRGVEPSGNAPRRAVVDAFDPAIETRPGAVEAVAAAAERGPIAVCSNCSVPEVARRALLRAEFDRESFDAIVTSVGCGWRKPDPRIFEAVASDLDRTPADLVHVGDDERTDGGIADLGGEFVHVRDVPLSTLPAWLEGRA